MENPVDTAETQMMYETQPEAHHFAETVPNTDLENPAETGEGGEEETETCDECEEPVKLHESEEGSITPTEPDDDTPGENLRKVERKDEVEEIESDHESKGTFKVSPAFNFLICLQTMHHLCSARTVHRWQLCRLSLLL